MVSDLIKFYIENFDILNKNERHEIFDQICLDELNIIPKTQDTIGVQIVHIIYDYQIWHNNIKISIISPYVKCNKFIHPDELYLDTEYNIYKRRGWCIYLSKFLYDEISIVCRVNFI